MENERTTISSEVLTVEQIRVENTWNLLSLLSAISNRKAALKWCAHRRLIKNTKICDFCRNLCTVKKYGDERDGYRWVCSSCGFSKSMRDGSFFSGSQLRIQQILILLYGWCVNMLEVQIAREANVNANVVTEWCNFMREECTRRLDIHEGIGGTNDDGEAIVVEIDKFKSLCCKHEDEDEYWILGGIERTSRRCFLVKVPDRRAKTLVACIRQYILPGSHIVSDDWASYADIENIDEGIYQHSVIIHNQSFVDANDSFIHTQNIKNLWMRVKKKLKNKSAVCDESFMLYLNEFMYCNNLRNEDVFRHFLSVLGENDD